MSSTMIWIIGITVLAIIVYNFVCKDADAQNIMDESRVLSAPHESLKSILESITELSERDQVTQLRLWFHNNQREVPYWVRERDLIGPDLLRFELAQRMAPSH